MSEHFALPKDEHTQCRADARTTIFYVRAFGGLFDILADKRDGSRMLIFDGLRTKEIANDLCDQLNDCIKFQNERCEND